MAKSTRHVYMTEMTVKRLELIGNYLDIGLYKGKINISAVIEKIAMINPKLTNVLREKDAKRIETLAQWLFRTGRTDRVPNRSETISWALRRIEEMQAIEGERQASMGEKRLWLDM